MPLPSLRNAYESALLSNASTISTVESTLRNVSWFLPGRFEDAELASEGLYSALNLVSLYHDSILSKLFDRQRSRPLPSPFPTSSSTNTADHALSKPPASFPAELSPSPSSIPASPHPPPSPHALYTSHFSRLSRTYRRSARLLVIIGYLQLVLEMLVRKRYGQRKGWRLVMWLEGMKSSLRLILLGITRRPLPSHPLAHREYDPSALNPSTNDREPSSHKRNGLDGDAIAPIIPTMPTSSLVSEYILPRTAALHERYHPCPATLIPELRTTSEWIGETLHASHGLISVLCLLWFAGRQRRRLQVDPSGGIANTIRPLYSLLALSDSLPATIIPLALAMLSRNPRIASSDQTSLLTSEYANRDSAMAYMFLRGTVYTRWTRPKIVGLLAWVAEKPVIGLVGALAGDHLRLVDEYWYYTSS